MSTLGWMELVVMFAGICLAIHYRRRFDESEDQRRALEGQLEHSKMEGINCLAGGIAHDFNNLLTIIRGHADLMSERDLDSHTRRGVTSIQSATVRAVALTRQLLTFSKRQVLKPRIVPLNKVVTEAIGLITEQLDGQIHMRTELSSHATEIFADPIQLDQVLTQFVTNARDAMPDGGTLTIGTTTVEAGPNGNRGRCAVLYVRDTGCGMTEDTRRRAFEPFFTTKSRDKGIGMGLAMVYGIVTQSGGIVTVDSTPGRGSEFRVYIPATEQTAAQTARSTREAAFVERASVAI